MTMALLRMAASSGGDGPWEYTLVAGNTGLANAQIGYDADYPNTGSLTPLVFRDTQVRAIVELANTADLYVKLLQTGLPQDYFYSITLNGNTYLTAGASLFVDPGYTRWTWSAAEPGLVRTQSYEVILRE